MTRTIPLRLKSAFDDLGYADTVDELVTSVQQLYMADEVPWVVGYSGGKDSTAVLQLVWIALQRLDVGHRHKLVHVISTDTLVENPVVAAWVTQSLEVMAVSATEQGLPVRPHRLTPALSDSYWVNLIGRGYPAPRPRFRWCTERLKIKPANAFIRSVVRSHGEAIVVLGARKAESSSRSARMTALEGKRVRDALSPNPALPNCLVYSPIAEWSNDDVWLFLMQTDNPWGYTNKDLLGMYQGASPDGECPLVVDTTTPSCGDSRFGCWVCTLVEKDKSMSAMIQNDEEKEWMLPLLDLRNQLDVSNDRSMRDFRRMNGGVYLFNDQPVPGPYTQQARATWLAKLLSAQAFVSKKAPAAVRKLELITLPELEEIRRIWVTEKHEFDDLLPGIYEAALDEAYPGRALDEHLPLGTDTAQLLRDVVGTDTVHFELVRELLDLEQRHRAQVRRHGLLPAIERALRRGFFDDEADATAYALHKRSVLTRTAGDDDPDPVDVADGYVRVLQPEPAKDDL
jgi:DNA sulfur modification protein DndC